MCNLKTQLISKSAKGWKVILKIKKKFYSPATGTCYDNYKDKPMPKKIKITVLDPNFLYFMTNRELKENQAYKPDLVGRTSMFQEIGHAVGLARRVRSHWIRHGLKGDILIAKVTISKDLMSGTYSLFPIIAGRQISIDKIINFE